MQRYVVLGCRGTATRLVASLRQKIPIPQVRIKSCAYSTEAASSASIVSPMKLRAYQEECIETCLDSIDKGVSRIGVSLATGGGKTVIFANLIEKYRLRCMERDKRVTTELHEEKKKKLVLILVHRRELAFQAERTIKKFHPHLNVQIELANLKSHMTLQNEILDLKQSLTNGSGAAKQELKRRLTRLTRLEGQLAQLNGEPDVVICSIQTLIRRLTYYPPEKVSLIIIDEAHHAVARSYVEILEYFNALSKSTTSSGDLTSTANSGSSIPPVIGFSATFERQDKKALGQVMEKIVYDKGIIEMIEDQWLCDAKFSTVEISSLDLSKVAINQARKKSRKELDNDSIEELDIEDNDGYSSGGDFQTPQLSKVMNTQEINEIIVKTYLARRPKIMQENGGRISTMMFAVDIQHVKALHDTFTKYGINSDYVTSLSKRDERDTTIAEFKNNKIEVLINCGIFTEGTDMPNINCILLCRPTKSRSLLVQMVGRGLRLHLDKVHCHIIDFVSSAKNTGGIVSVPTLVGINDWQNSFEDEFVTEDGVPEMSIKDLQNLKNKIEERQKDQLQQLQKQTKMAQNHLEEQYKKYLNETGPLDITFTTFQSFKDYYASSQKKFSHENMSGFQLEHFYFKKCPIPWVNHTKGGWAYKIPKTEKHLLINKINTKEYELKALTEIPYLTRMAGKPNNAGYHSGVKSTPKYHKKVVAKSDDINLILMKSQEYLLNFPSCYSMSSSMYTSAHKKLTISKFSKWRQTEPSDKQKTWIRSLATKYLKNNSSDDTAKTIEMLDQYLDKKLTKGEALDLIFACSLSSQYPIKKFVKNFPYRLHPNSYT